MTPGFSVEEVVTRSSDGHHFIIHETFYYTARDGSVDEITAGMGTDGASTPHILWPLLPPFGKYWRAVIRHDKDYRYTKLSRPECDARLLEAMEVIGICTLEDYLFYEAVRAGGQSAFDADRKAQQ